MASSRGAAAKAVKSVVAQAAKSAEPKKPKSSGLTAPQPVSPACRKFFGQQEMSRVDAMRAVWAYIKSNNLQDPAKKREIVPDEKLKSFLNCKDRIVMTEIPGLISAHFPKKST